MIVPWDVHLFHAFSTGLRVGWVTPMGGNLERNELSFHSMTGHKTEAQLMTYIKIDPVTLAVKAAEHEYFTGSPLRVAN